MYREAALVPNPKTPSAAVLIDGSLCTGCNSCVEACRTEVLVPDPKGDGPPLVMYPDECWFGGCCVAACPVEGAIRMEFPLNQRVGWKRKETGEHFRVGMKNPPAPNTRPPVGSGAGERPELC